MYVDDTHLTSADNDMCSIEASLNQDLSNIHVNRWLIAYKIDSQHDKNWIYVTVWLL